jgi:hypothetical protein
MHQIRTGAPQPHAQLWCRNQLEGEQGTLRTEVPKEPMIENDDVTDT